MKFDSAAAIVWISLFALLARGDDQQGWVWNGTELTIPWGFNIHDDYVNATTNDTLIFNYDPIHTVYQVFSDAAYDDCDLDNAVEICGVADSPCVVPLWNVTNSSSEYAWFVCSFHCASTDMKIEVRLSANETEEGSNEGTSETDGGGW